MFYSISDEEQIARQVEESLKKEGTFDRIRKKATENLRTSEILVKIEAEFEEKVEKMLNQMNATDRKEKIQKAVREMVEKDKLLLFEINRQTKKELEEPSVRSILKDEINKKVTSELEKRQ